MKFLLLPLILVPVLAAWPTAAPGPAAGPPAGAWAIDGVHSSVLFQVKHARAAWFWGAFTKVSGDFRLDVEDLEASSISINIDAASIASREDARDRHLRSPDFFDVKQFPAITFKSDKVTRAGDGAFTVAGRLSLRGVEKPLTVTVQKTGEGEFRGRRIGYETRFAVKRSDFGMTYGLAEDLLGDEVTVLACIEGLQSQ